ncbi:MAG: hypothetical protein M0Z70_14980 [Nitrospiraceae bacterium]|nr:hypothetical protein [Nitrospirota bacterium]MDA8340600.1 hypothetical protein [Nitrospiraceae bacterium]
MSDNKTFSLYAILYELNEREFQRKLHMFPEDLRYYAILAGSIIGSENSKRIKEAPKGIIEDGEEFVSKLLELKSPEKDGVFREILETYLIETLKDELRFCCPNCLNFNKCLGIENLSVGELFKRRANGEETDEIKRDIKIQIENALQKTPHINTDEAHKLCKDFIHQYNTSNIGEVFGRYADIAAKLQNDYGIDYRKIQQQMVAINMEFYEKSSMQNKNL